MGGSHPLARRIGAWPSVGVVTAVTVAAAELVNARPPADHRLTPSHAAQRPETAGAAACRQIRAPHQSGPAPETASLLRRVQNARTTAAPDPPFWTVRAAAMSCIQDIRSWGVLCVRMPMG